MKTKWISVFCFPLLGATLLIAEPAHNGPCREDVEKFCKEVKPGEGRIVNCLKAHESELSQGCRQGMAERKKEVRAKVDNFKAACETDIQQFCKNVQPGEGRIIQCLKQNEAQLSSACREALPKKPMNGEGHKSQAGKGDSQPR